MNEQSDKHKQAALDTVEHEIIKTLRGSWEKIWDDSQEQYVDGDSHSFGISVKMPASFPQLFKIKLRTNSPTTFEAEAITPDPDQLDLPGVEDE